MHTLIRNKRSKRLLILFGKIKFKENFQSSRLCQKMLRHDLFYIKKNPYKSYVFGFQTILTVRKNKIEMLPGRCRHQGLSELSHILGT